MASTESSSICPDESISAPIRISKVGSRYLVFSATDVMRIRREHNMCSVFVGTTPLAPSQNAFLSLPLELLVEEARLLLSKGVAYVVDGTALHLSSLASMTPEKRREYIEGIRGKRETMERQRAEERRTHQEEVLAKKAASGKMKKKQKQSKKCAGAATANEVVETDDVVAKDTRKEDERGSSPIPPTDSQDGNDDVSLFSSKAKTTEGTPLPKARLNLTKMSLTPISSIPDMIDPPISSLPSPSAGHSKHDTELIPYATTCPTSIPETPSYALYAYMHSKGYFLTPGIRFGCDFSVYPGDPMRFHAHYLASSFGWDQDISMLDIVGPGRLATAVKKGFVIGGERPKLPKSDQHDKDKDDNQPGDRVRAFCIEWAGM